MAHQADVVLVLDDAAAGRQDQPLTAADRAQRVLFQLPEVRFPLELKDHRDAHARVFCNQFVQIDVFAAHARGQHLGRGGLAAGRHADQGDVFHLYAQLAVDAGDFAVGNFPVQKELCGVFGLRYQHFQPVAAGNAHLLRLKQQLRAQRIVDHVHHRFQCGEGGKINRLRVQVGIHPQRRGVEDHLHILLLQRLFIADLPVRRVAAGDEDFLRAQVLCHGARGLAGAAAAQNQHFSTRKRDAVGAQQGFHPGKIRIVAP